jgi:hypothetical protein
VTARAQQLIGEEMALQHVGKARHLTQVQMAKALNIGQDSVSRLQSRGDLLVSTLQGYIEAMGGSLKLVVEFRDGRAVLSNLGVRKTTGKKPRLAQKSLSPPDKTYRSSSGRARQTMPCHIPAPSGSE